jgi:outer membrane protein assembly factor BamB
VQSSHKPRGKFPVALAAVALSGLSLAAAPALAAPFAYTSSGSALFVTDLDTGSSTLVGALSTSGPLQSLAWSPARELFGADQNGNLYRVDETSGATTLIGDTGLGNIEGMDFLGPSLIAISFELTPTLYVLDTTDANPSPIITVNGTLPDAPRSLAVLDDENVLVTTNPGAGPTTEIYQISLTTGDITLVGASNIPFASGSLDFGTDGLLYLGNTTGGLYQIDPTNGSIVETITTSGFQGTLAMTSFRPLVSASAPEPATFALLVLGGAAAVRRRRSRG